MTFCPVEADTTRYLAQQAKQEAAQSEFDRRMADLVEELTKKGGELDKFHPHHLQEALGEADDAFYQTMARCMDQGHHAALWLLIEQQTTDYWTRFIHSTRGHVIEQEIKRDQYDNEMDRAADMASDWY